METKNSTSVLLSSNGVNFWTNGYNDIAMIQSSSNGINDDNRKNVIYVNPKQYHGINEA